MNREDFLICNSGYPVKVTDVYQEGPVKARTFPVCIMIRSSRMLGTVVGQECVYLNNE